MDNYPQQYQPLSHALHPPRSSSQPQFYKNNSVEQQKSAESDDDDEGMVEEQLSRNSAPPSPPSSKSLPAASEQQQPLQQQPPSTHTQEPEPRRRGRPKGSKTRRNRVADTQAPQAPPKPSVPSHPPLHPTGQGTNPPQLPEVNTQNQQYYEFQWRVLNLCAEFYGAAEELVKATPALVIAQCYHMGPSSKVDPLIMLNEAKQNCDILLANPSRLISSPPPPMYPVVPTFYHAPVHHPPPGSAPGAPIPAGAPAVISQPQSFVVSMSSPAYPMYAPPPSQYPTTSYYQYSYPHPGAYYAPAPHPATDTGYTRPAPVASATPAAAAPGAGNSGAWSEEEMERLKKLVEEKKNSSGEVDWDDVVSQWGNSRTRHQILIKATQLGLKENSSSVRGVKRRREADSHGDPGSSAPTPTPVTAARTSSSSTPSSTPVASPALQHRQKSQNPSTKPPPSVSTTPAPPANQPWPMPVVAVNTSTPVIGTSFSHYRPRPTDPSPQPTAGTQRPTTHSLYVSASSAS
ncbi:hypothetical protein BT96DRAFT_1018183 [Gymnopus androsaceus JB14]|uniref:Myb-like domain-containing protein n=1 Tax=Gymnopus androsaceus JB14 TaxID=1447944 RepID=A0A6A4HUE0_9AGAR|nr:hypothetical protein BT96DRAFT_1018183 [Gymnopus androsaceus JB14]